MVHTVPTSFCSIFTYLINPIAYLINCLLIRSGIMPLKRLNPLYIFYLSGHGTSKTIFHSFINWKKKKWMKIFKENNLKILFLYRIALIYSMHKVFPFKFMKLRRFFGRTCGSGDMYVLKEDFKI